MNADLKPLQDYIQAPIIEIVNRILAAKLADPNTQTSELEAEIDRLVYGLYSLTEREIKIVEGSGLKGREGKS